MHKLHHYCMIWNDRVEIEGERPRGQIRSKLFSSRVDIPKMTLESNDIEYAFANNGTNEDKIYSSVMTRLGIELPNYTEFFVTIEKADGIEFINSPTIDFPDYCNDEKGLLQVIYNLQGATRSFIVTAYLGNDKKLHFEESTAVLFKEAFNRHGNHAVLWSEAEKQMRMVFIKDETGEMAEVCPSCYHILIPTPLGGLFCSDCGI